MSRHRCAGPRDVPAVCGVCGVVWDGHASPWRRANQPGRKDFITASQHPCRLPPLAPLARLHSPISTPRPCTHGHADTGHWTATEALLARTAFSNRRGPAPRMRTALSAVASSTPCTSMHARETHSGLTADAQTILSVGRVCSYIRRRPPDRRAAWWCVCAAVHAHAHHTRYGGRWLFRSICTPWPATARNLESSASRRGSEQTRERWAVDRGVPRPGAVRPGTTDSASLECICSTTRHWTTQAANVPSQSYAVGLNAQCRTCGAPARLIVGLIQYVRAPRAYTSEWTGPIDPGLSSGRVAAARGCTQARR